MPQFAHPYLLLLVLVVPFLVWLWHLRPRAALRFPTQLITPELPTGRARRARWFGVGLRTLALLALVLALAGPRWPDLRTRVATEGVAIAMVVDVSGSMAEPDFLWGEQRISRLEAVKRAFGQFVRGGDGPAGEHLDGRPSDLIALVTFATRPRQSCPLTLSHSAVLKLLDDQQPCSLPTESQTNIGDAIAWGLHRLESAGSLRRIMVLLSDGEHNVPPPALKPRQSAQLAGSMHVPIYTIDAGGDKGVKESVETNPSPEGGTDPDSGARTLRAVASLSGGRYFRAQDAKTLLDVCGEIDRLERKPVQSFQYRRYYQTFAWFGLGSFVFLLLSHLLETTLWQKAP